MRISHFALAFALIVPTVVAAQDVPEITEQSVVEAVAVAAEPRVEVTQNAERRERDFGGNRENGGVGGGWRGRDTDSGGAPQERMMQPEPAPQPRSDAQPRFDPQPQAVAAQFEGNRFGRSGEGGASMNTSPPQVPVRETPVREARSDGGLGGGVGGAREDRGDRFGNRDSNDEESFRRRFGDRGGNGPQIDTRPQPRVEGQVFDQNRGQNRDGRFGQPGQPDVVRDNRGDNRNGVFTRDWRRDGGRHDGNRDGRFDRDRGGPSGHRFERHDGGWIDRGNRSDNDWGRDWNRDRNGGRDQDWNRDRGRDWNQNRGWNRNWNRDWRGDRRYNWQGYRNQYRDSYRQPRYYNPYGYGYGYQRHGIGAFLNSLFFGNRYWINDPYEYRLPAAPFGYRWIRYYNDVLLVDQRNGYVVDVIYSFFW